MKKNLLKDRLLLSAFILLLIVFGALLTRKILVTGEPAPTSSPAPEQPALPQREVILYFGALEGTHLVAEAREIGHCDSDPECMKATVQALIQGPAGNLVPILPNQATLRELTVNDGTATLDFSRALAAAHPGGSMSELLTVYGLTNTLAVNFPYIRQVRILLEGEATETLKGHVGLHEPIKADFRFSRPPEEPADGQPAANSNPETHSGAAGQPQEVR